MFLDQPNPLQNVTQYYVDQFLLDNANNEIPATTLPFKCNRTLLFGEAGIGKTTLCRYLVYMLQSNKRINQKTIPIYIRAREIEDKFDETFLLQYTSKTGDQNNINDSTFSELISSPGVKFIILIDGMDEINISKYFGVTHSILAFIKRQPAMSFILTSRPFINTSLFDDEMFCQFHLKSFNEQQIQQFIDKNLKHEKAADFVSQIRASKVFSIDNPLMLSLAIKLYDASPTLPTSRYNFFRISVDYLLSSWDSMRGLSRISPNSFGANLFSLRKLAYRQFCKRTAYFSLEDFQSIDPKNTQEALAYFLHTGILAEVNPDLYSFTHKSFLEYFLASYFIEKEYQNGPFEEPFHFNEQVANFILDEKDLAALNEYISRSTMSEKVFVQRLMDILIQRDTPPALRQSLTQARSKPKNDLSEKWASITQVLDLKKKGKLFEEFVCELFGPSCKIVERNLLSSNGEFDMLIENKSKHPFWYEFNIDYLIECKNQSKPIPLKDVMLFSQKVANSRIKLGIIISLSGFTRDAKKVFENISSNIVAPLIVPISGADLEEFFENDTEKFEDFFKAMVRRIKLKKKY